MNLDRALAGAMILAVVLLAATGFHYEHALRAEEHRACLDTNTARAATNSANEKTKSFLLIATRSRAQIVRADKPGTKKMREDERTLKEFTELANSYRQVPLRKC